MKTTILTLAFVLLFCAVNAAPTNYPPSNSASSAKKLVATGQTANGLLYVSNTNVLSNAGLTYTGTVFIASGTQVDLGARNSNSRPQVRIDATNVAGRASSDFNTFNLNVNGSSPSDFRTGLNVSVGSFGVGTSTPSATAHIAASGTLILRPQGAAPFTCSSTLRGGMAMTSTTTELCFCNGTSWLQVDSGSACSW